MSKRRRETLRDATREELSTLPDWLDRDAEKLRELFDSLTGWLSGDTRDAFTAFLLGVGAYLTVTGRRAAPPGLPTLPSFRRREGARFLAGAHRRLTA